MDNNLYIKGEHKASAKIIIVDDNLVDLRLCQRTLERASFYVDGFADPRAAIEMMEHQKFSLLLVDIYMPYIDGFELIGQAKVLQPDITVLVMTGKGTVEDAVRALERGVDGLIFKPFGEGGQLVGEVQKALLQSKQRQDASRLQALRPLFDVSERLNSETNPHTLTQLILNSVGKLLNVRRVGIFRRCDPDLCFQNISNLGDPLNGESNFVNHYLEQYGVPKESIFLNSSKVDPELAYFLHSHGLQGVLIVPVVRKQDHFLFFAAQEIQENNFSESDLEVFGILARQAAIALENVTLYEYLRENITRLEESQMALIQAEKMAAVGRMMATVAHEVNNPLQAVRNCMHLASRQDLLMDQRIDYMNIAKNELDRLVDTVQMMLEYYRPGRKEKEKIGLRTLVAAVLDLMETQLKSKKIIVHLSIPAELPNVYVFKNQIQQVLFNLIVNAIDAMETIDDSKDLWLDGGWIESGVILYVEDSGRGIDQQMVQHVFEPFYSTKVNGTGLGLAISHTIVDQHGGNLRLGSPHHRSGACFEMMIPVCAEE